MFKIKEFSIKYRQNKSKLTKNEICKIEHEIQALDMAISKSKSLIFQNKREELKHHAFYQRALTKSKKNSAMNLYLCKNVLMFFSSA